jgi:hypothetical protein
MYVYTADLRVCGLEFANSRLEKAGTELRLVA